MYYLGVDLLSPQLVDSSHHGSVSVVSRVDLDRQRSTISRDVREEEGDL